MCSFKIWNRSEIIKEALVEVRVPGRIRNGTK